MTEPTSSLDVRYSDPEAAAAPWADTHGGLRDAELYWITTVRADGRPHVTPMVAVWHDGGLCFVTGVGEQKQHNLAANAAVAITTGSNGWERGVDVVLEGRATRVTETGELTAIASAFLEKYGEVWRFEPRGRGFATPGGEAWVLRVPPTRVFAFAKDPHGQTTYRWPTTSA